jgi:riboflavin-specific deaminase-like protein
VSKTIGTRAASILQRVSECLALTREEGLPLVTVSWAQSASGAIARADGTPVALSGPESLLVTHHLRALHDAILVGIGTVIADNPLLSVRLVEGHQPRTVILDSNLRFPADARLLAREDMKPWIFHAQDTPPGDAGRELQKRGARLFPVPRSGAGLDLRAVLRALAAQGISSVMVEGGARVLRSFLASGCAAQAVVTVSPAAIDGVPGPGVPSFRFSVQERHGNDTVTWGII